MFHSVARETISLELIYQITSGTIPKQTNNQIHKFYRFPTLETDFPLFLLSKRIVFINIG